MLREEEKQELNRLRKKAVRAAWAREQELCRSGMGTVNWTKAQQRELLATGRVSGYEGQHMKSVSKYPQYAGDPDNIQLLSHDAHLEAHNWGRGRSGYRSPTNGYYDSSTQTMHSFRRGAPRAPEARALSSPSVSGSGGIGERERHREAGAEKWKGRSI